MAMVYIVGFKTYKVTARLLQASCAIRVRFVSAYPTTVPPKGKLPSSRETRLVSLETRLVSLEASRFSRVHCKYRPKASSSGVFELLCLYTLHESLFWGIVSKVELLGWRGKRSYDFHS